MRQIEIEESTFNELAKMTTPLKGETADTVISRLIRIAKRNGQVPTSPARATGKGSRKFITRKINPDKLSNHFRQKFINEKGVPMTYWQAAEKVFISCGQKRLTLLNLAKSIFDFPNNPKKPDRLDRAVRSLEVAMRGYSGSPARKLFNEPELDVFEYKVRK